jgi:phosphate butyryltransferase
MTFFAKAESAGLVLGAKAPIVLTSRADSDVTKLNSIALGVLAASKND